MNVQVWNPEDAEDEVLAMVCRTGLNTQMGSMVRELVTPTTLSARKDNFVKVSNRRPASSNPRPAFSNAMMLHNVMFLCFDASCCSVPEMLCCVCAIPCCAVLCYALLCHAALCHAASCHAVPCRTELCCAVPSCCAMLPFCHETLRWAVACCA